MRSEETIRSHNLSPEEYEEIVNRLRREPNDLELGIFSVMWSEHCSYKSSRKWLKMLPTKGDHVLQGPGENAGIVDLGGDLALAFKIESHNHPSYVEPFQGAATGVGGILRDVFTMGARPIASLDSLHFGNPDDRKNRYLLQRVVAGISWYGNCIGVPTVGGETRFDDIYSSNPLVNAFTAGLVQKDRIRKGVAAGVGNPVIYVGTRTGRDGIHGATFASDQLDDNSDSDRPAVQVGDPFSEKLLLEACMELFETDLVIGIQDMGAAGLTSSSTEMAERGGVGLSLDLSLVPQREENMSAYEIMLSESQERMLLVGKKGAEKEIARIFSKWDLDCAVIGKVISEKKIILYHNQEQAACIPLSALAPPLYERPVTPRQEQPFDPSSLDLSLPVKDSFEKLLKESHQLGYMGSVFHTYDYQVGTNTVVGPGRDAAVLRIKGTGRAVAMNLESNARLCYLNPREGAKAVISEAVLNQACMNAVPLGITNCLNFGSPEKPQIMWEFSEVITGMKEACEFFRLPVTGGNVSFYNDYSDKSIFPTPVIGITGLIADAKRVPEASSGTVYLLGRESRSLSGSVFLRHFFNLLGGSDFKISLKEIGKLQELLLQAYSSGTLIRAHDVSEGGLVYSLLELVVLEGSGLKADLPGLEEHALAFSEIPGTVLAIVREGAEAQFEEEAKNVPYKRLGCITAERKFEINGLDWDLGKLRELYFSGTEDLKCFAEIK